MPTLATTPDRASIRDVLDDQGIAQLALAQLATYVTHMPRMSGRQRKALRDALANCVADLQAEGVTR